MNPLKVLIFTEIRKTYTEFQNLNDDELNKKMFHHVDGLRLSLTGFRSVKNIFTAYSFELPNTIKSRHLMALSEITYPYFVTSKRLIFFSDADAMIVKLAGGVEQFLENCFQFRTTRD